MTEIRCPYCGELVRAEESTAYQQVLCPACGHSIPVPGHRPGDLRHAGPPVPGDPPDNAKDWAGKSNKEIAAQLLTPRPSPEDRNRQARKMLLAPLLPHYDDLTLFTVSLAFLLLFWIDGTMRHDLILCLASGGEAAPALILFLGLGMVCSLLSVFLRREKFQFEKGVMLLFAVLVTAGTGLYAGWLMLGHSPVWLMVFPVWNILNAGVLLVLLLARVIDTECVVDEKATFGQVVITALAVPILLTICQYLFELHWATTCSIAVAYTMNLHDVLRRHMIPPFWGARNDSEGQSRV